jgi:hypothetical protein
MPATTSRTGTVVPTSCEACGADRELVKSGERTAARCAACGTVEDVAIVCAPERKWTVVDAGGTLRTFATRGELLAFLQPAKEEEPTPDVLSVRDLTVVPVPPLPANARPSKMPPAASAPPPPLPTKARTLSTLAPPPRGDAPAPPPPSIPPPSIPPVAATATSNAPPKPVASKAPPPKPANASSASNEAAEPPARKSGDPSEITVSTRIPPARNGWMLPAAAVAVVAGSIFYAVRSSPPSDANRPTTNAAPEVKATVASPASATPSALPSSSASTTAAPASASAAVAPAASEANATTPATPPPDKATGDAGTKATTTSASGSAGATESSGRNVADNQLTLAELLTKASAARKSGDVARARALLDRALIVNPGNVEAYAGLGELSRAGGDLAGAKASFEKALATSPSYSPALLGLADTEWDLGDRASAQRHYRTLVSNASSPPERAKARAAGTAPTGGSAGTTAPAPTSTVKTLTSADFPPPAPPPKPAE